MTLSMLWRSTHKRSRFRRVINKRKTKGNRTNQIIRKRDRRKKRKRRKSIYRNFRTNSSKVDSLKSNGDLEFIRNSVLQLQ
jgi:hypothetical protein